MSGAENDESGRACWYELVLHAPQERVEDVSDALEVLGALSVAVEDADAGTPMEQALFGEPSNPAPAPGWHRSLLTALFDTEARAREAAALLVLQDFFAGSAVLGVRPVADTDWVRLTQSQFGPVSITPDFWIVPSWHEPPPQARTIVRLDPGLAFGTGTHPTTRMCLRWIACHPVAGRRMLDYGCGSGILAIAAAKYGAASVDAVDIDKAAVESARHNAAHNGVTLRAGPPDIAQGQYALVLANILANPLKMLAPLLCTYVAEGGDLVLAGILERQAQELRAAYAPWLTLQVQDSEEGWVLMTARRAPDQARCHG